MCEVSNFFLILYFLQCCIYRVELINRGQCGYKQCPQTREGALNVHLIPHSHMDAGWVKTFDEYYYGTRTQVSTANVQLIFHSVLSELLHDNTRKFTFAETAYFWRWWKEQRPSIRSMFRSLVQEGRLEIAGGSWVQNDEATADYEAIIDSYTWGLRKINDTLGPCAKPKAAWQIDTYGHSREQASLLAQMGYDGLFISRVDYKEREMMIDEDRLEFMWRGSDLLGKMSDIMTHTLFNLYNPPDGFCFDYLCNDEPIMDNPGSKIYNADKRVSEFIAHIEHQAKYYDHDNIVVMMGGDFAYQSAASWFMNMDKLINHVHTHAANLSDINIFYSSPSCYLKAIYLYGRRDKTMHTERGDHLPYGTDAQTYWSGYYTSRPSLKYLIKRSHQFLQVLKQLSVVTRFDDSYELHLLRHAVSLAHHHDAITGTSQQHVANDFIRILTDALDASIKKISVMLSNLTPTWGGSRRTKNQQQFVVCHDLNISQCIFSESQDTLLLLLYNPSSVKTYHYIKLPASTLSYSIKDSNDDDVEYQMVPLTPAVINLPGRKSTALQEVVFEAENIPAMGYSSFYISAVHDAVKENSFAKNTNSEENLDKIYSISNEYIKVHVNKDTGLLESMQHLDGVKMQVSQNFFYYSQTAASVHSGAYSFRPGSVDAVPVSDKASIHTIRGPLVKEIRQRFSDWVSQVIRLYRGEEFVELEWIIGPVPLGTDLGKEVVTRFMTNISSQDFFTDSNGRQVVRRSCWNESNTSEKKQKFLPSCYYPVTSRICIQANDSSADMCVLTDRAQGGTSYRQGELEIMVHRRLLTDDGFGLEESLNEEEDGVGLIVRGKHRIVFGRKKPEDKQSFFDRVSQAALRWKYEPWAFMASGDRINRRKWANVRNKRFSALHSHGLPRRVHILTLAPWKAGSVLLRLENTLMDNTTQDPQTPSSHEDSPAAENGVITVDLRKLFLQLRIASVRETTLAANQWLDEARQMDWSSRYIYNGNDAFGSEDVPEANGDGGHVDYDDAQKYGNNKQREQIYNKNKMLHSIRNYQTKFRSKRKSNDEEAQNILSNSSLEENEYRLDKLSSGDNTKANTINKTNVNLNISDVLQDVLNIYSDEEYKKNMTARQLVYVNSIVAQPKLVELRSKSLVYSFTTKSSLRDENVRISDDDYYDEMNQDIKRVPRKPKSKQVRKGMIEDDEDDVTKSVYEMYYKKSPGYQTSKVKERTNGKSDPINYKASILSQFKSNHNKKLKTKRNKDEFYYESPGLDKTIGSREKPAKCEHRYKITPDQASDSHYVHASKPRRKHRGVKTLPIENVDSVEDYAALFKHTDKHEDLLDIGEILQREKSYNSKKNIKARNFLGDNIHWSAEPNFNFKRKRREVLIEKGNLYDRPKRRQTKSIGAFMPFFITDEKMDSRLREHRKTEAHKQISDEENSSPLVKDMFVKKLDTKAIKRSFDDDYDDSYETSKITYIPPPSSTKIVPSTSTSTTTVHTTVEEEPPQSDEEDVKTTKSSTTLSTTKVTTETFELSSASTSTEAPETNTPKKSFTPRRIARVKEKSQYNIFDDEDKFRDSSKEEKGYIPSKSFKGLFAADETVKQPSTKVNQLNIKSIFSKKYRATTESTDVSEKYSSTSKITTAEATTDNIDLKLKEFFEKNLKIDSNHEKHAAVAALNAAITDKILEVKTQNPSEPEKELDNKDKKKLSHKTLREIKNRSDENAARDQIAEDLTEYHNAEEDYSNRRRRSILVKKREEMKDTSDMDPEDDYYTVTLRPSQIRTFVVTLKSSNS